MPITSTSEFACPNPHPIPPSDSHLIDVSPLAIVAKGSNAEYACKLGYRWGSDRSVADILVMKNDEIVKILEVLQTYSIVMDSWNGLWCKIFWSMHTFNIRISNPTCMSSPWNRKEVDEQNQHFISSCMSWCHKDMRTPALFRWRVQPRIPSWFSATRPGTGWTQLPAQGGKNAYHVSLLLQYTDHKYEPTLSKGLIGRLFLKVVTKTTCDFN